MSPRPRHADISVPGDLIIRATKSGTRAAATGVCVDAALYRFGQPTDGLTWHDQLSSDATLPAAAEWVLGEILPQVVGLAAARFMGEIWLVDDVGLRSSGSAARGDPGKRHDVPAPGDTATRIAVRILHAAEPTACIPLRKTLLELLALRTWGRTLRALLGADNLALRRQVDSGLRFAVFRQLAQAAQIQVDALAVELAAQEVIDAAREALDE